MLRAALILLVLASCSPQSQDQLARSAAKSAVAKSAAQNLPGVPVEPYTDCIIDNADSRQILTLAADSVTGPTAGTWEIITAIARKPATLKCLLTNGVGALL
jgi:hypothetical protein